MGQSIIACRYYSYAPFLDRAYEHLASIGVRHVEIDVPSPDELDARRAELEQHGLTASSLHGQCDLHDPGLAEQVEEQMPAFAALGTKIMFASVDRKEMVLDEACHRLREAGEVAAAHGVTIVLETHPDLITNAEVALETMKGVDHPNVRVNFDTANIYFYNHGVDGVEELKQITPYVGAVHLKDTDGGYRSWHFPALGQGIVEFPKVFEVLDAAGFSGPCTLEIEGIEGEEKTEELVCGRVAESVEYLRRIGRF